MGFLDGKRCLIAGLASKRSIAWGIASAMREQGAELAFTYQGEKLGERVKEMAAKLDSDIVIPMDVSSDAEIETAFELLKQRWDHFDAMVHSIGFAPAGQLDGNYLDCVTREGSSVAHDISSYSFAAMGKVARHMMPPGSAMLTLSYLGSIRSIPQYNVMGPAKASLEANVRFMAAATGELGIRVNGISAGPIRTLASAGVGNFKKMLQMGAEGNPLKRNITIEEVGNAAAFMCSDLASGITGEVMMVDNGYSTVGTPQVGTTPV
ncbi:MAG: enoyl-ACP reductase [Gammaproteobacteria bacterium]|nr:enoyl-ACP reductase [Gammaproteobacteria bacterium]